MNNINVDKNLCSVCGKKGSVGNSVSHSQHKTKRMILPNIQKNHGILICTRCLKTEAK